MDKVDELDKLEGEISCVTDTKVDVEIDVEVGVVSDIKIEVETGATTTTELDEETGWGTNVDSALLFSVDEEGGLSVTLLGAISFIFVDVGIVLEVVGGLINTAPLCIGGVDRSINSPWTTSRALIC